MLWLGICIGVGLSAVASACYRWMADTAIEMMDDDARGPL